MEQQNLCNYCIKCMLKSCIHVHPSNINKDLRNTLKKTLQDKIGNKCIKEGYVLSDTIEVVKYSAGVINAGHFTGEIRYSILYTAQIYNPAEKTEISCKIVNKNKMGILAEAGIGNPSPMSILLSRQHHSEKDSFKDLEIGNEIFITVVGKRYELNDKQIFIIGKLVDSQKLGGSISHIPKKIDTKNINNILINIWLTNGMKKETQFDLDIKQDTIDAFQLIINNLYRNNEFDRLSEEEKFNKFLEESKYSPLFSDKIKDIVINISGGIDSWYTLSKDEQNEYIDKQLIDIEIKREIIPSNYTPITTKNMYSDSLSVNTSEYNELSENDDDDDDDMEEILSDNDQAYFSDEESNKNNIIKHITI